MKNNTTNNYDTFMDMLAIEQDFFAEDTITVDEYFYTENIADDIAKEKEIQRYIRSFNAYNN